MKVKRRSWRESEVEGREKVDGVNRSLARQPIRASIPSENGNFYVGLKVSIRISVKFLAVLYLIGS